MISFSEQISEYVENYKKSMNKLVIRVAMRCTTNLVERSPVSNPLLWQKPYFQPGYDGGYFKGNWQVTFDTPATSPINRIDPVGITTVNAGKSVIRAFNQDVSMICITNCTPYAEILERGNHSKQVPPQGMVGLLSLEFQFIVNEEIANVR